MAQAGNQNAIDLTGLWNGLYDYPRGQAPVTFTAQLVETHGWIAGATQEVATAGTEAGRTLTATVQGRRSGAKVTFLKLYDDPLALYDSVSYEGMVDAEGTEIAGRWSIAGSWSGTFLMIRAAAAPIAAERTVTAKV